ncbi:hypothetical protein [Streptomyces sp. NPDC054849]
MTAVIGTPYFLDLPIRSRRWRVTVGRRRRLPRRRRPVRRSEYGVLTHVQPPQYAAAA